MAGKFILIILFFNLSSNWNKCVVEKDNIKISILSKYLKKYSSLEVVILLEDLDKNKKLNENVKNNQIYYQHYLKDMIHLINNQDTLYPEKYIFEDNFEGILPYHKILVNFKNIKKDSKNTLAIQLFNNMFRANI
jgi:hypothetical protein